MKKLLGILLILLMGPVLIIGLQSCDDGCPSGGGYRGPSRYKLIGGYNSIFNEIDSIGRQTKIYKEFDTLSISKPIRVNLYFNTEYVAFTEPKNGFAGVLMACSPVSPIPPVATQTLVKLSLISKNNFGTSFAANDTINSYFKSPQNIKYYPYQEELKDLNSLANQLASQELKLVFTARQPVTAITPFQFEAILTLSDSSEVRLTSKMVYLKN